MAPGMLSQCHITTPLDGLLGQASTAWFSAANPKYPPILRQCNLHPQALSLSILKQRRSSTAPATTLLYIVRKAASMRLAPPLVQHINHSKMRELTAATVLSSGCSNSMLRPPSTQVRQTWLPQLHTLRIPILDISRRMRRSAHLNRTV